MQATRLVGRADELAVLSGALHQAARGTVTVTVVEGEAGVGKTRLVDEALNGAVADGFRVARGAARELDRARPLAPLALPLGLHLEPPNADPGRIGLLGSAPGVDGRFQAVDAAVEAIETRAADGPFVLAVDDVHWADAATLHTLDVLARRDALPLAVVATTRASRYSAEVAVVLDALVERGTRLALAPLDANAVAELVTAALGGAAPGPHLLSQAQRAGGNPFYVMELLGALEAEGSLRAEHGQVETETGDLPLELRQTVLRRLAWLPDDVLEVLQLAAILGRVVAPGDLAAVLGRPVAALLGPLETARRSGVLGETPDGLAFRHDLVREAIYDDLPNSVRVALHGEVYRALAAAGAPGDRVAYHAAIGAAPGDAEAVELIRRAVRDAIPRAPATAVELLEKAIALDTGAAESQLRADLVTALVGAGRIADADRMARAALATVNDAATEGLLRAVLAQTLLLQGGRTNEALAELETAAQIDGVATAVKARLLADAALGRLLVGEFATAQRHADLVKDLGREAQASGAVAAVRSTEAWLADFGGDLGRALEMAEEAVALARTDRDGAPHHIPEFFLGMVLVDADRLEDAVAVLRSGRERAEQRGLVWALVPYQWGLALAKLLAGQWDDAAAELEAGHMLCADADTRISLTFAYGLDANLALHRGDLDAAERALASADQELASGGLPLGMNWVSLTRALVLEARGRTTDALETLSDAFEFDVALGISTDLRSLAPDLVRVALLCGERDRAASVADTLARLEPKPAPPTAVGATRRVRGLVDDDPESMIAAVASYRAGHRPLDLAAACNDAAPVLARAGRTDEATQLLDEAVRSFDALRATYDAGRARAAARELGLRIQSPRGPRRRSSVGWESLTPTETEVVKLVAEGLTNPQIGERLFISRRTVSTHLSHVFAKLGIRSRTELARVVLEKVPT